MKYKVGDKVKVYGGAERDKNDPNYPAIPVAYHRGTRGTVLDVTAEDEMNVRIRKYPKSYWVTVHPKQCRKLKKKAKKCSKK